MTVRVLLLDGDHQSRQAMRATLEEQGYEVVSTIDGPHALTKLAAGVVSVIVMEVAVETGGMAALRRICRVAPHVPMIVTTRFPSHDLQEACMELGVLTWMLKPVEPDWLVEAVQMALRLQEDSEQAIGSDRGA